MALVLEDFAGESPLASTAVSGDSSRGCSYDEGYAAGMAAAAAECAQSRDAALSDLVQRLSDLEIGYCEAQSAVLTALGPLFAAITDSLLPSMTEVAQIRAIHDLLVEAAERDSGHDLRLILSGAMQGSDPLPLPPDTRLRIEYDDLLTPGQAILASGSGETFLNTAQVAERISDLFGCLVSNPERSQSHG